MAEGLNILETSIILNNHAIDHFSNHMLLIINPFFLSINCFIDVFGDIVYSLQKFTGALHKGIHYMFFIYDK